MRKFVSVIMPVYNGSKTLKRSLSSIFDTAHSDFEVIVINDGSKDNSSDIARGFPCRVFDCKENKGPANARNVGVKNARGELLLFTDADCIVEKDWVQKWCDEYERVTRERGELAVMGGRVLPNNNFVSKCLAYSGYYSFQHGDTLVPTPNLCASNLLVEKRVFDAVGGFDEKFINGEDRDLTCQIYEKGHQVLYNPFIFVIHEQKKSMFEFFEHQRRWGNGHGRDLEVKYQKIRKLNTWLLSSDPYFYLLFLSVPISLAITCKSIQLNFKYDKSILLCAPFIFVSKLSYRWGIVQKLFSQGNKKGKEG